MWGADLANQIYCRGYCQRSDCNECPLQDSKVSWRTFVGVLLSCCLGMYFAEIFGCFSCSGGIVGVLPLVLMVACWIFLLRLDSRETERR